MDARHYRASEALRDGTRVEIRAIRPDDKEGLREGFHHLSEQSVYRRFLSPKRDLYKKDLDYLTEIDYRRHVALVATLQDGNGAPLVGVARYIVLDDPGQEGSAEFAIVVMDAYQQRGLGTLLLRHLARIARESGILAFEAEVLSENRLMLEVLEHLGFKLHRTVSSGVTHVSFPIADRARG